MLFIIMKIANDKKVLEGRTNGLFSNVVGWTTFARNGNSCGYHVSNVGAFVAHLWHKRHIKKTLFIARIGNARGQIYNVYINISLYFIIFSNLEIS